MKMHLTITIIILEIYNLKEEIKEIYKILSCIWIT